MTAAELEFPPERIQVMHLVVTVWYLSREVLGRASPMLKTLHLIKDTKERMKTDTATYIFSNHDDATLIWGMIL